MKSISFCKMVEQNSEYYEEQVLLSTLARHSMVSFLDISAFGKSLFRGGARLPITSDRWVLQLQISGQAHVETSDGVYSVYPGDLLVIPPKFTHTYVVPEQTDMRKYFMIFRSGPLPDILLNKEIQSGGVRIRKGKTEFRPIFEAVFKEMSEGGAEAMENLSVHLYRLLYLIQNQIMHGTAAGHFQMNLREAAYDMASGISLDSLADRFGVGKYSLIRQFKKETGQAPIRYMIALRLQHAEQLLLLSSMSITEIAAVCGYSSPSFFAAEFKKHLGMTPRQFRQQGGQ